MHAQSKKKQEYKTLLSIRSQNAGQLISSGLYPNVVGNDVNQLTLQDGPTYSAFAEDFSELKEADKSVAVFAGTRPCAQV